MRQMATLELKHWKKFVEVSVLGVCMLLDIFLFGVRKEGEDETSEEFKALKSLCYASIVCGWFLLIVILAISSLASSRKKRKSNSNNSSQPSDEFTHENPLQGRSETASKGKNRHSAYTKRMSTLSPSTRHMFGADRQSNRSRGSEDKKMKGIGIIEEGEDYNDGVMGIGMSNLNLGFGA